MKNKNLEKLSFLIVLLVYFSISVASFSVEYMEAEKPILSPLGQTSLPYIESFEVALEPDSGADGITINKPSGTVENDLLVASIVIDGADIIGYPDGWGIIATQTATGMGAGTYYKVANASEGSSYTFTWTNEQSVGGILRISGANVSGEVININTTSSGSSGDPVCADIVTTVDNCLILRFIGIDDDDNGDYFNNYPSGHEGIWDRASGTGSAPCSSGAAYVNLTSKGNAGVATWDLVSEDEGWASFSIAIAPSLPNQPPTQSGESPTNSSTGINILPSLYVICSDVDGDTLNATWWSNYTLSTYYFDDYDTSQVWATSPQNMVDNNISNYTSTNQDADDQILNSSSYAGDGQGNIVKVEMRAYGYRTALPLDANIKLRPIFDGVDSGEWYEYDVGSPDWSPWYDITDHTNAPGNWEWSNISTLNCHVQSAVEGGNTVYCSKVEIRVSGVAWVQFGSNETSFASGTNITQTNSNFSDFSTKYWWSVNLTDGEDHWCNETYYFTTKANNPPTQASQCVWNASTGVNKSLNATNVDRYPTSFNVTVNDTDGHNMNVTIMTNESGSWTQVNATASGMTNGTYEGYNTSWVSGYSTQYWISFNVSDGYTWSNETFNFTTSAAPVFTPYATLNFSCKAVVSSLPDPPSGFTATTDNRTKIDLTWSKGNKADYTQINYAEGGTPPPTKDSPTFLYNGTGESTSATGLDPGTQYSFAGWSWNQTENTWSATSSTDSTTTTANQKVVMSNEDPSNTSTGQILTFTWYVTIEDPEGDWFNWTLECNNSQTNSANQQTNGSKGLPLSGLSQGTTYTVWANASDQFEDWTRNWYTFTTETGVVFTPYATLNFSCKVVVSPAAPIVSNPGPANGSYAVDMYPVVNVTVDEPGDQNFNITWKTNRTTTPTVDASTETDMSPETGDYSVDDWSHTCGDYENDVLVVCYGLEEDESENTITSVEYGGQSFTEARTDVIDEGVLLMSTAIWYLLNPPTGTDTIYVNFTGAIRGGWGGSISIYNVQQVAPLSNGSTDPDAPSIMSTDITTLRDNSIIIDVASEGRGDVGGMTAGTGQSEFFDADGDADECGVAGSYEVKTTAGIETMTQDWFDDGYRATHTLVAFEPYHSWLPFAWNDTCTDGNHSQNATWANLSYTKFWWQVCVNDTDGLWTNKTYHFTTANYSWSNWGDWWTFSYGNPPTQSSQCIWNASTGVNKSLNATNVGLYPTSFNVTVNDSEGDMMNVTMLSNESGSWLVVNQTTSGMNNGTYQGYNTTWVDSYSTQYWISFNVSDETYWTNETYNFTTQSITDTTPPNITINFAGNLSDQGGPYWQPPGESVQLSGVWSDGYSANDSQHQEDWRYVNITANDSESTVTNVWLQFLNRSAEQDIWTNWTYAFSNTVGEYWEYNTSGNIQTGEGYNYSFNVVANSTGGSNVTWWNKTGIGGGYTRIFVQLNCSQINMSYTPYYLYETSYSSSDYSTKDRMRHDQGHDGTSDDTGILLDDLPTDTVSNIYGPGFAGAWFDNSTCIIPFTSTNIYYHIWWNTSSGKLGDTSEEGIGWKKNREELTMEFDDNYQTNSSNNRSEIYYDGGTSYDNYYLDTRLLNTTTTGFTDNDIYESSSLVLFDYDGDWNDTENATDGIYSVTAPDLTVASNNSPHVVYARTESGPIIRIRYTAKIGDIWTDPFNVSGDFTENSMWSKIGLDSNGYLHVVWFSNDTYGASGEDEDIFYRNNTGGSWNTIQLVSQGQSTDAFYPDIHIDSNDDAHVAWQASYNAYYCNNTGGSWGTIDLVSDQGENLFIVTDSDNIPHVLYWNTSGTNKAEYRNKTAGTWSTNVTVSDPAQSSSAHAMAINNDVIHFLWEDVNTNNIYYRNKSINAWGDIELVSSETDGAIQYSTIDVNDQGTVCVAWQDNDTYIDPESNWDICYKTKTIIGWSSTELVSKNTSDHDNSTRPYLTINGNAVHVIWVQDNPGIWNDNIEYVNKSLYNYSGNAGGCYPSVISNRSFMSFVLYNVPSNATLNASYPDSDSDGLSDWTELYQSFTHPFINDTDNDTVSDYVEFELTGSDPNNYTDTEGDYIWMDITNTTWDLGQVVMGSSNWTNATGETFITEKYNCTVNTDLRLQITIDAVDWTAATSGNPPSNNIYRLNASIDIWSTEDQIITASVTTISVDIPADQNETFDLRFDAPTTTSSGEQQIMTVTATLIKN